MESTTVNRKVHAGRVSQRGACGLEGRSGAGVEWAGESLRGTGRYCDCVT